MGPRIEEEQVMGPRIEEAGIDEEVGARSSSSDPWKERFGRENRSLGSQGL